VVLNIKMKIIPTLKKLKNDGKHGYTYTNYCREIKSFKTEMKEKKVCKRIKKQNIEKIRFEMYKDCLFNNKETRESVCNIISKKLKLYSVVIDKVALSPYDDKRYLVNQIKTLPYGYYKIDKPFKNY
jgi:hypothetical protein